MGLCFAGALCCRDTVYGGKEAACYASVSMQPKVSQLGRRSIRTNSATRRPASVEFASTVRG